MGSESRLMWARALAVLGIGLAAVSPLMLNSSKEVVAMEQTLYWTRDSLEPDTIASIWLLRRFVSPSCEIRFAEVGAEPTEGIPFDIPLVDFSRTRTKSTFTVIREHYQVEDPSVMRLAALIDEIEVGGWNREPSLEANELEKALRGCAGSEVSLQEATENGLAVLDEYCGRVRSL